MMENVMRLATVSVVCVAVALSSSALAAPDYSKRLAPIPPSVRDELVGRWQNPVDHFIIEITSVDLQSGAIEGKAEPTSGPAQADEHKMIGWVSAAPAKDNIDNVVPITFSTTLYEYGTLPAWAGFLKDHKITTMHYLVWPNKGYVWDHISSFSETWSKL
jgi:hypothetical protein